MKPCVATLQEDEPSPFAEQPRPLEGTGGPPSRAEESDEDEASDGEADDDASDEESDEEDPLAIDFDGMSDRIETFPVREAEYRGLDATESRVFWMMHPIEGSLGDHWSDDRGSGGRLQYFSLDDLDDDTFAKKVESFRIGPDGATMAMEAQGKLRVVDATGRAPAKQSEGDQRPNRESGWIDLDRVTAAVRPRREWEQMLHEAWRLMEAYYWREDMGGVDWEDVWDRYSELLDRVSTRSEFSDLVWVMQGELGTSHAYEMGGDYEHPPQYRPGYLGADVEWDDDAFYVEEDEERTGAFRLEHIVDGSSWEDGADSPLNAPGLGIETGDLVVGVNGERFDGGASLQEALVHRSGDEVELTVASDGDEVETETVDLLHSEREARYREWVQNNRDRVHEATDGEIGYVHIPDMGPRGFSEFHRAFASERERTGLIVDVRFNGGGHVSQLILEKLAREPIGYDRPRWHESEPYPHGAIQGPMVAIANEYAGSDGDIFSHCFKLMDLGPVVGKRTWGGVVGIWPRHRLVDRSVTTQPEFASWFRDVGFGLENRGTEPDIEVEVPPGEMVEDDPQLERAIEEALERLEADPPEMPDLEPDTDLAPPDELD